MQIEIDFEVFKQLTARLQSEADSYNEVVRRLLGLPSSDLTPTVKELNEQGEAWSTEVVGGTLQGVWYGSVFFPDGTIFRSTYKGRTFYAEVREGRWFDQDGTGRTSPSDAASAISRTNVNGWKFWYGKRPTDSDWYRLDEFRQ
jgi:hypothetical protein